MQFCKTYNLANGNVIGTFAILLAMALLSCIPVRAAEADALAIDKELPAITMIPGDGMNLEIAEQISSHYVVVKVNQSVHNWFAGTFTNLPTNKKVTIGLSMEGMDTTGNKADVTKWKGLMPVMTYGDPTKYETYEWFQKDGDGRWVSGSPLRHGEAKFAGTGKVPEQTAIPIEVADQFLSDDGSYWSAWREIDTAEAVTTLNIYRIRQQFSLPNATIAMRVPYTYAFLGQLTERLKAEKFPGVTVDTIGTTRNGKKLTVIRVENTDEVTPLRIFGFQKSLHPSAIPIVWVDYSVDKPVSDKNKVILVLAREHSTEHASSWVVDGLLKTLIDKTPLSDQLRKDTTWLLVPIQDPDGSIDSTFDQLTDQFWQHSTNPIDNNPCPVEVLAYANYFRAFVNSGRPIAASVTWHNVECNEGGGNIFNPFTTITDYKDTVSFDNTLFDKLKTQGYMTGAADPAAQGYMRLRLYGWCGDVYKSFPLAYEINDRYPQRRLSLKELTSIGSIFANTLSDYFSSDCGVERIHTLHKFLLGRAQDIDRYYSSQHKIGTSLNPSIEEIITLGY